jgi:hypothetical protein
MDHEVRSIASVALASTPGVKLGCLMLQLHVLQNACIVQELDGDMRETAAERLELNECGGGMMVDRGCVHELS